jgi:archaellum component FlaC
MEFKMDLNQKEETTNPIKRERRGQHQQSVILWIVVILVFVLSSLALALSIYASIAKTDSDSKLEEINVKFDRIASTANIMSSLLMHISSNTTKQHEERIADLENYRIASTQKLDSLQELVRRLNASYDSCSGESCYSGRETNDNATSQALASLYSMNKRLNASLEELIGDFEAQNTSIYMALNSLFQELNDTVEDQLPQILELYEEVSGLIAALNQSFEAQYQQLNATVATSLMNLFSKFQLVTETIAELTGTLHELSVNISGQGSTTNNVVDLTVGCISAVSTCVISHNNVGTPPASTVCETDTYDVDVPGFRNVNIFCNVDNSAGEINPLTSTLNIYDGEASCLCSLVALTTPTASPTCKLTIQRCPETVRLGLLD